MISDMAGKKFLIMRRGRKTDDLSRLVIHHHSTGAADFQVKITVKLVERSRSAACALGRFVV